jgi:hypothetical protein
MFNGWVGDDSILSKRMNIRIRVYPRKYLSRRKFDWVINSHTLLSIDSTVDDKGTLTKYLFVNARQLVHLLYHSASSPFCSLTRKFPWYVYWLGCTTLTYQVGLRFLTTLFRLQRLHTVKWVDMNMHAEYIRLCKEKASIQSNSENYSNIRESL